MQTRFLVPGLVVLSLLLGAADSRAIGPGDLKKKAEKKAKEAADKATKKADSAAPSAASSPGEAADAGEGEGGGEADGKTVSTVSTKFDFVPGDRILLMDDFTRDDLGEFPSRWKLVNGNFDVVDFKGERWLRLNGDYGIVAIRTDSLPEKWTCEFDIYQPKMNGPAFTVGGLGSNDGFVWFSDIGQDGGSNVMYQGSDGKTSRSPLPDPASPRHHVSVMARDSSVKLYVDRARAVNVPEMPFGNGAPVTFGILFRRLNESDPLITNVRFAEGGKPKIDMMATPFVTHGIVFDSGSDRLKPESAPVLRQVASYLKENPEVKVMITGHTDDVGETAANQTLSEKRAAAVAASLAADFGIDAARLAASGKGESAPMTKNDTPEGRAMNRRVEFSKN